MRVLVCGGRQFEDVGFLWKSLDDLNAANTLGRGHWS